jgi:hypothetical protein
MHEAKEATTKIPNSKVRGLKKSRDYTQDSKTGSSTLRFCLVGVFCPVIRLRRYQVALHLVWLRLTDIHFAKPNKLQY